MRRTKAQIAADMLAHQKMQAVTKAISNLLEAFTYAGLKPPMLAMTREERQELAAVAGDYFYMKRHDSFGWEASCALVDIIERKRNDHG